MRDEGYTSVEVLVALMIIGLSLTAMAAAVAAASQIQRRGAVQAQAMERTQALANDLDALMASEGPFSSSGGAALQGQTTTFQFDCDAPELCAASIQPTGDYNALTVKGWRGAHTTVWRGQTPLQFTYIGTRTISDHWPPDNPTNWQRLRAIALVAGQAKSPVAVTRIWIEGAPSGAGSAGVK